MSHLSTRLNTARTSLIRHLHRAGTLPARLSATRAMPDADAVAAGRPVRRRGISSPSRAIAWAGLRRLPLPMWSARYTALAVLLVCVVFYLAARIGLALHFPNSLVYFVWPPSVVLFVALLLSPRQIWWVYALALLPVHMIVELGAVAAPPTSLVLFYVVVWTQALAGVQFVDRFAARPFQLNTVRALIILLVGGAGVAALTEAITLATVLELTTSGANFWLNSAQTVFADALTMLVLAPALVSGWAFARRLGLVNDAELSAEDWLSSVASGISGWLRTLTISRVVETVLLTLGLLGVGLVAFGGYVSLPDTLPALLYAVLPLLLWTAARFGVGGTSLVLCGMTLMSIVFAVHLRGPFSTHSTTANLFSLQLYFIAISVPLLVLAMLTREREDTRATLQESETRFRTMADQAPVLIWMSGTNTLCTYFNAVWLNFTGRTLEQERGTGWTLGVHPDDVVRCLETYLNAFTARQPFEIEYRLRRHDGAYRWVVDSGLPRYASNGRFEGYIGSAIDISDRKRAVIALEQSEARYRDLVESQTEMICRYLPDSTLTFVNDAYCQYYGSRREQLIGTKFLDLMDDEARDHHMRYTALLLEGGTHESVDEHKIRLPDGGIGWQHWVDHAIRDVSGNVVEIQAVGRDITERKRVEAALQESEARFRAAFESAATGMMLVDATGRAMQVNRPLAEMLGYPQEELLSRSFMDLTCPDDLEANLALFRACLAGEIDSYQLEKRFIHKQGHPVWTSLSAAVVRDAAGQVRYFIGHVQDITERKHAEEELRASEERYRAVVNNFPHGVVLLFDQRLRHDFADGQGLPDIGLSKAQIEGKTIWEAFPADLTATLAPRYQAALLGEQAAFDLTYAGHTYRTHVLPIRYAESAAGMIIMQEVTEQRQASALAEQARVLAEIDRAKTAFFSNISHEFRTPLTLLLAPAAEALADRDTPLPLRQRERLEMIQRGGLRLHKLVDSLLEFSRIEAGHLQAAYAPTDVATLTAELASIFRSAVERAGLRLVIDCATLDGLAQPVYVDHDMWERIVFNLLSNALKFTFEGEIAVSVRTAGDQADWVELEVRDTGVGIPARDLPHVFERFYRVPGTWGRTNEGTGTGIGLALVQELVHLHGGVVRATSTPGVGSSFTVAIPTGDVHLPADRVVRNAYPSPARIRGVRAADAMLLAEEVPPPVVAAGVRAGIQPASATQHDAHAAAPTARAGGATILVADDNTDMRAYLARVLSERWNVRTVADGPAALAAARAQPPDLILADVIMPGLDGFALITALRGDPQTQALPVILLSARAGDEATVEGLEAGADDYLIKPFSVRELLARVQTHLDLARARREAAARAAQLDAIFEAIGDGVLVHDLNGNRMYANPAYHDLLRRHLELRGQNVAPDVLLASPSEMRHYVAFSDEQGRAVFPQEWATARALQGETLTGANAVDEFTQGADGEMLHLNVTAAPIRNAEGQITGAVAVFRDVTERRRLERQFAEQANLLEAVFESKADGVAVFDVQGNFLRANQALGQIFGTDADTDYTSRPLAERMERVMLLDEQGRRIPEAQWPHWRVLRGEILAGASALDARIQALDGREVWISITGAPIQDSDGQLIGVVLVTRDVTARRKLERQAAEQASQLEAIFDAITDGVLVLDEDGRVTRLNPAGRRLVGLDVDKEALSSAEGRAHVMDPRDTEGQALQPEQLPTVRLLRGETLAGETAQTFTLRLRPHSSEVRTVSLTGAPLRDADSGRITGAVAVMRDITELRHTQAALVQQERLFRTLVENSPDIITRFDRNLRHLYVSPSSEAVVGIPADSRLGKTYADLGLPETAYAPWERALRTVFATGKAQTFESGYHVSDRPPRQSRVTYIPEFAANGSVESVLGITTDITSLKQAEEALRAATATAEASRREEERRRCEAERREQIAASLRDVLTILNSDRQMPKILDFIVRQAGRLLGSEAAAIYMTDSGTAREETSEIPGAWVTPARDVISGSLALQAAFGLPPALVSSRGKRRLNVDDAAVRRAMVARLPVAVLSLPSATKHGSATARRSTKEIEPVTPPGSMEPSGRGELPGGDPSDYLELREEPLPAPYHALLAIPIVAQGQAYGSLLLLYTTPRSFSADEVALAMAYGDQIALAVANTRLQDHIERAAIEAERNRLARDLHDTVTQEIFTASVLAESIPQVWERRRAEAEANLRQVHQLTRGALAALRALLLELRPAVLEQKTLADLLRQLGEVMEARTGIPIALSITDDDLSIPTDVKVAFYRIAQEALMNAGKYARANNITVRLRSLRAKGAIQLEVEDDGQGFDTRAIPAGHFGIGMMHERARGAKARVRITSRREHGTRIAVKWDEKGRTDSANRHQEYAAAASARRGDRA